MYTQFEEKAIKWLETKAYPYSKTDEEALTARDVLSLINAQKTTEHELRQVISSIEDELCSADINDNSRIAIEQIIANSP